jgi:hypothetical protein
MSNLKFHGALVAAVAVASTVMLAAPASAANGTLDCPAGRWPLLKIDAKASGNKTWQNLNNATQNDTKSFPAGYSDSFSPWQKSSWVATNGGAGFYNGTPTGSCY